MAKPIVQLLIKANYRHIEQAKNDILNVVKHFKLLTPKIERYIYPNGVARDLVCLDGTIPVLFRDVTYNIPICIFISELHPLEAPICYVRPTRDMTIKTSRHVDGSGRVYLPYLSDWKKDASDLLGVIHVMQVIFGQMCPVYQKSSDYDSSTSSNPVMPALPSSYYPSGSNGLAPAHSDRPGASGSSSATKMPTTPSNVYPFSSNPYPNPNVNGNTITGQHIRASLLSAVQDRLKFRFREKVHQLEAEIEVLKKTTAELHRGKQHLDEMKERMSREVEEVSEAKTKLVELDELFMDFIIRYDQDADNINPDQIYGPTEPLFKQLLDAFAEENALVDAIYYTSNGLLKGVIPLDVYLKSVRELSRRQFMLRALIQACRAKASLPV